MALTQPKWPSMSFLKRLLQPASLRRWKSSFISGCPVSSLRDRKPTEERIPQPFSSFMLQPSPVLKRTKDEGCGGGGRPLSSSTKSTRKTPLSCDSPPRHGHPSPRRCLYIMVAEPPCLPVNVDACFAPPVSCMWSQQQQLPAPVKDPSSLFSSCLSVSINSVRSPTLTALGRTQREWCLEFIVWKPVSYFNPTEDAKLGSNVLFNLRSRPLSWEFRTILRQEWWFCHLCYQTNSVKKSDVLLQT